MTVQDSIKTAKRNIIEGGNRDDSWAGLPSLVSLLEGLPSDEDLVSIRYWAGVTPLWTPVTLPKRLLKQFIEEAAKNPIVDRITTNDWSNEKCFYRKPTANGVDYDLIKEHTR